MTDSTTVCLLLGQKLQGARYTLPSCSRTISGAWNQARCQRDAHRQRSRGQSGCWGPARWTGPASGSEGLRERRPPGGRARLVPKQLQGESAKPSQVPTPRPTCAYRCPGLTPPACGPGPQPGEAVCPRRASALVPGPLLVGESALGRLAQTPARAQEGPPAALSAVSACEVGLGPRGAGSQPPLPSLWGLGPPHRSLELVWFSAKAV